MASHYEKLVYDVTFNENSTEYYSKNEILNDNIHLEFKNGKYVTEFTVTSDLSAVPDDIKTEIPVKTLFSLITEFSVDVKVVSGNNVFEHTDTIRTKTLFLPQGFSFAPIYSESNSSCILPYFSEGGVNVALPIDQFTVNYGKDKFSYTQTIDYVKNENINAEDAIIERTDTSSNAVKYNFRGLIDNAQLLFALRNIKLDEKASFNLPVLSESYKEPKTLSITNASSLEKKIALKYNGTDIEETLKYDLLTFRVNSTNTAGLKQFLSVQSAAGATLKNYALPIEYARAVIIIGNSYPIAGTLIFSLSEVMIND